VQLVIIAGGLGMRLRERLGDLPKPMAPVGGKPLLEHQILLAKRFGIEDILLLLGHGADVIRKYCEDGARWGVRIRYHEESRPLGTAGAMFEAAHLLRERVLVMYGDTMLNVDLTRFAKAHDASGAPVSILLHPNDHPADSDLVEIDEQNRVVALHPYPHRQGSYLANLVNAALYILDGELFQRYAGYSHLRDFGKNFFPFLLEQGVHINGYKSREYIKDAGTPERLDKVSRDFASGKIARSVFCRPAPAVFLDRDGTLNREAGYVRTTDQLELFHDAAHAVRRLNEMEMCTVLITNQPVVARGECTERELKVIHNKLESELGAEGAYLDAIYYCPHHPDSGFSGERKELKFECSCRKPRIGMIQKAAEDLNLKLSSSWLIGDSDRDMEAANRAGLRSILISRERSPVAWNGPQPDAICGSLTEAVDTIARIRFSDGEGAREAQ
jgi:histidinol-phosphate phosphatase family protein